MKWIGAAAVVGGFMCALFLHKFPDNPILGFMVGGVFGCGVLILLKLSERNDD